MTTNTNKLGDILKTKITSLVLPELDLRRSEEHLLEDKLDPLLTDFGKAIERKLNAAITKNYSENYEEELRTYAVETLGIALAQKFAQSIIAELKDSEPHKLPTRIDEVAEAYRQFSEEDLDSICKEEIESILSTNAERYKRTHAKKKAEEEEKDDTPPVRNVKPRSPVKSSNSGSFSNRSGGK